MSTSQLRARSNHAVPLATGNSAFRVLFILFTQCTKLIHALPLVNKSGKTHYSGHKIVHATDKMTPEAFYFNLFVSMSLVLAGGCFAGLTLGLMGQDEVYLKVMASSGDKKERKYANKVLNLISRGKHWVLVTLLLSNVITNETLPIVLDRCLGGGWPAVVTSTAAIVIFGEIIPQSICVRYGLQVGSMFAPFVLVLMYALYPVAYPISLLLDHILGEDHGTVYKKSGLKTLVTLHKTMGVERLNQDEVTIISAVLDLKEKPVSHIMTPMDRVYTMSADAILDEKTVEEIFNAGFSRIPIHLPKEPLNFIGMLLVRVLISYDPEDALPVASFPLATLPETGTDTSCLNILNYFQEGKSHMVVVSEHPGEPTGALGVLTLEDVIEELIGEEIVDESDVYIDINKNIKRLTPGPLSKRNLTSYLHNLYSLNNSKRNSIDENGSLTPLKDSFSERAMSPTKNTNAHSPVLGPADVPLNWKPKNPAANPLDVNKSYVTIKRPNIDTVKNAVLPGPDRSFPGKSKSYGAIHVSEEGALREAKSRQSNDGQNGDRQKFLLPEERETDVSEIVPGSRHDSASEEDSHHLHQQNNNNLISLENDKPEQHERSYKTGGIIESIINVQGVHKTIIENVSDDESDYHPKVSPTGSKRSETEQFTIEDNEEGKGLLSEQSNKHGSSSLTLGSSHSQDSRAAKKFSVWDKFMNGSSHD
ncbi:uncharacterized protein PRCAT00004798001 [Priceomyces carsonii]|uniref:uncharacterized protein n=1 Tax=Priceomyces carsonii TaxID=28549 RepID=UPI002ED97C03|nr:unnamed protein product [Priceomyces carsonii]